MNKGDDERNVSREATSISQPVTGRICSQEGKGRVKKYLLKYPSKESFNFTFVGDTLETDARTVFFSEKK